MVIPVTGYYDKEEATGNITGDIYLIGRSPDAAHMNKQEGTLKPDFDSYARTMLNPSENTSVTYGGVTRYIHLSYQDGLGEVHHQYMVAETSGYFATLAESEGADREDLHKNVTSYFPSIDFQTANAQEMFDIWMEGMGMRLAPASPGQDVAPEAAPVPNN
jgi:hypothetical protein